MDKMSSIVTDVLNLTCSLLWNKACDHTGERLEGDLADEKCRQLIVRKLDAIRTETNGLAKGLYNTLLFLKEGVGLLCLSVDTLTQVKGSHMTPPSSTSNEIVCNPVVNRAWPVDLSNTLSELKNSSEERFSLIHNSFERSNDEALKVFNDEALSIKERILATKLLVISKILGNLEDPDAASETCQFYLKELHHMTEVQELFSIFLVRGFRWVSTMFRNLFKKTERLRQVMSVTLINFLVFDFTKKFTKKSVGILNWPVIEVDGQVYNPIIGNTMILQKVQELGADAPDLFTHLYSDGKELDSQVSAVNSKGDIVAKVQGDGCPEVIKISCGRARPFCSLSMDDAQTNCYQIKALAVDDEDTVYIVANSEPSKGIYHVKLFVFDAQGEMINELPLAFLYGVKKLFVTTAITRDKDVVILERHGEGRVYVCGGNGELKDSFPVMGMCHFLSISDKNEIIVAGQNEWLQSFVLVYTLEGKLEKIFDVADRDVLGMVFNHFSSEVNVFCTYKTYSGVKYCYLSYHETDKPRQSLELMFTCEFLTSHSKGPVALVYKDKILHIQ